MKVNPFAGATAGLKKVVIKENSTSVDNTQKDKIQEQESQKDSPQAEKTKRSPVDLIQGNLFSQENLEEIKELERKQQEISKDLAEKSKLDEEIKKACFDILAGYIDEDGKKVKGKYKISIAGNESLSGERNALKIFYTQKNGKNILYCVKELDVPQSIDLDSTDIEKINKIGLEENSTPTIETKQNILKLLYEKGFISGSNLVDMAKEASENKAQQASQSNAKGSVTLKDSSAQNISAYLNANTFVENRAHSTIQQFNNTQKLATLPKLKSFVDNLAILEDEGKLPKLNESAAELKKMILDGNGEKYESIKTKVAEVKAEISVLFNADIMKEIKDEVKLRDSAEYKKILESDKLPETLKKLTEHYDSSKTGFTSGFIANRMKNLNSALSKIKQFEEFDDLYKSISPEKLKEIQTEFAKYERGRAASPGRADANVSRKTALEKSGIENVPPQQSSMQLALAAALAAGKKAKSELSDEVPPQQSSLKSALAAALIAGKKVKEQGMVVGGSKTETPNPVKKKDIKDLGL